MDGTAVALNDSEWQATVIVTVRDAEGVPVAGAKVYATWNYGSSTNCTTDINGQCSRTSGKLKLTEVSAVSLTVDDVIHPEVLVWAYDATGNTDPDGDSDGTVVVLERPQ
jgi:hypothetical protein